MGEGMRARTSAVLMLMATLLASHAAGFACIFDCDEPPSRMAVHDPANAAEPGVESACHRKTEALPASPFSLRAAPHECESHSAGGPLLTSPRAAAVHNPSSIDLAVFDASMLTARAQAGRRAASARDLAPPGSGPRLIAPLRI